MTGSTSSTAGVVCSSGVTFFDSEIVPALPCGRKVAIVVFLSSPQAKLSSSIALTAVESNTKVVNTDQH
jgi:hypothetical protein